MNGAGRSIQPGLAARLGLRPAVLTSSGLDRATCPVQSHPNRLFSPSTIAVMAELATRVGLEGAGCHRRRRPTQALSGRCLRERRERRPASHSPRSAASRTVSPGGERSAQRGSRERSERDLGRRPKGVCRCPRVERSGASPSRILNSFHESLRRQFVASSTTRR